MHKRTEIAQSFGDNLISGLYTAATDPSLWPQTLATVVEATGSVGVNVLVKRADDLEPQAIFHFGLDLASKKRYLDYYHQIDTPLRHLLKSAPGRCQGCHTQISDAEVSADEYYQDFYIPDGLRYCAGGYQLVNGQLFVLAAHRATTTTCFDGPSLALLQQILVHLPHVFYLQNLFNRQQDQIAWLSATLDKLPQPVMVTDCQGRIRYMNGACDSLKQQLPSLVVRAGKIGSTDTACHTQLQRLIRAACGKSSDTPPAFLSLNNASGLPGLEITVTPLRPEQTVVPREGDSLAMLLFRSPFVAPSSDRLSTRPYGLTPAELRLASALIEGASPESYADSRELMTSTVRSQIRSILAKTGTRNIVGAVSLLSGLQVPHETTEGKARPKPMSLPQRH
ncbi:MAG: hypothetical protein CL583_04820 [Alteromonadaceae bacterium]|nr:hypothetical protein [Alteromonadaceae bacterium]